MCKNRRLLSSYSFFKTTAYSPHRIFSYSSSLSASVLSQIQRSIGQEFADLDSIYSNFDHEEVFLQTIEQMQNYEIDIENMYLQLSQEYQTYLENRSAFDVISLDNTIKDVLEKLYVRPFIHREHHNLLWVQDIYKRFLFLFDAPTNLLLDPDQKVGFLKVVGNTLYADIKKLSENTNKVFKYMQISIHYQYQYYISCGATEQEVSSIKSYGIVVYLQKIIPLTKTHVGINESPVNTLSSKASRTHDTLKISEKYFCSKSDYKNTL
ncbi:hypothetical protein F8M41_012162 [Gigaspora margarita]|uniref:Uncharacterized protein n=1 Tax=Gigaspora margarita TaxID=4874 RepID=A0A8H3WZB5_GIGMA|nr:hypothetical protein F8M41_012162 [Gigaspora margarita]